MSNDNLDSKFSTSKKGVEYAVPGQLFPPKTAEQWYERNAHIYLERQKHVTFDEIHHSLLRHLPKSPGLVLDIGAGTGRDAVGFAELGHDVTAVEPSVAMTKLASQARNHPRIDWHNDRLPKLKKVRRFGLHYDVILLSAVWMHVAPSERKNAFRRLVSLLKPGGLMHFTLRRGPHERLRGFWDISLSEVQDLARDHGLFEVECSVADDMLGREGVTWSQLTLRSPGDGTGALPLLRGIILNDKKSSTYKLGLLRVLLQIAQNAAGIADYADQERIELPLGLFALYWLRMYRPLLDKNLPQAPRNTSGTNGLGFADPRHFDGLKHISPLDLRIGMKFDAKTSNFLHAALRNICNTLVNMPMTYTTYPGQDEKIFVPRRSIVPKPHRIVLDKVYLSSFGTVSLPFDIWETVHKYGTWIEPAIISEWKQLMKRYSLRQRNNQLDSGIMDSALQWTGTEHQISRSTAVPRARALELINSKKFNHCVWSGRKLNPKYFDMDHCFPFSVWPCDDLWNLLPSSRSVNQYGKRDKLPSKFHLRDAEDRIQSWWDIAYKKAPSNAIKHQFFTEASSSLRVFSEQCESLEDVFEAVIVQQTNLKFNQQVPEWEFQ